MATNFEELDYCLTPIGPVSLRRQRLLALDVEIYEVKLGDDYLMSSMFTVGERALATLALQELDGVALEVVVGGLCLGYTAAEVLKDQRISSLHVIELLGAVIGWHRDGLVPLGAELTGDPRCRLVQGDFFKLARSTPPALDPASPGKRFHAVLLDIDHTPDPVLHPDNRSFYRPETLASLSQAILPGGVFAMWSDAKPAPEFLGMLKAVFGAARADVVVFDNPLRGGSSDCTIYVARNTAASPVID